MSEFVAYLSEVFAPLGPVQTRKMFGGHGLFHDGLMIGLVVDDALYLKADKHTADLFRSKNSNQFEYTRGDKIVKMCFFLAPEEIYDDPEEAGCWGKLAYQAALRAKPAATCKR